MQTYIILNPSLAVFCVELQKAFEEGYRLDPENLPVQWGVAYEATLTREEQRQEVLELFQDKTIKSKGRPKG